MSTQNDLPPLPRRIWWPWDEPARRVGFYRAFRVPEPAQATLYVSASGPFCAWLDDCWLPVPDDPLPPWRVMRRFTLELTPGLHALNILAASGEHGQPFLLACLDWDQRDRLTRIGTDETWHVVCDPPLEWMPAIPENAQIPPELVPKGQHATEVDELDFLNEVDAWRHAFPPGMHIHIGDQETGIPAVTEDEPETNAEPTPKLARTSGNLLKDGRTAAFEFKASAYDGVWAEPWGMPANAPDDFCRLSTGWQEHTDQVLAPAAAIALHQGLTAAGTGVWKHQDGGFRMRPVAPFPQSPPQLDNERPPGRWHEVRDAHARRINGWLDQYEARAPHAVLDVGEETFGRVRVRLERGGPAILALTTGESEPEVHRYDRRSSDVFTLSDGQSFTTTPAGFRYVKLIALSCAEGMLDVEPLVIQHIRHPVHKVGGSVTHLGQAPKGHQKANPEAALVRREPKASG